VPAVEVDAPLSRARRLAFALFYAVVLVLGVALGVRVIVDGYSPVPYADLWGFFPFIERGLEGDVGLPDLWEQWNEHRFLLARIQFLVDYRFFEGTNVYLFAWIATSCLLLAGTFAAAVWFDTRDWLLTLGVLAVAGTSALPLAGVENLTLAVQVQFVQVFLWTTVSILAVVLAARSTRTSRQAIGSALAAIAPLPATYSLANGLLAWVVVVVLAVVLRLDRRCTAALAVVGLLTTASFLWHFESTGERTLSDPVGLAHYVVLYLGAAPTPNTASAAVVGAVGLVLLVLLCGVFWADRSGRSILVPFGAGVSVFIALTAAQTATGRLDFGVSQALASRYSIASYMFWLGLFVGFLPAVRQRLRPPLAVPGYLAGAAVVALGISYAALPSSSQLRSVVAGRQATVVAYRAGVEDVFLSPIPGLQFGPGVTSALRFLEREKLGPWAPGGMVDAMRVTGPGSRTDRECLGQLDFKDSIPGGTRLRGWIAAPGGDDSSPNLVVLDAAGRRTGLGLVGLHRPDVAQPGIADAWRGFVAFVRGTPTAPLEVVLLADDGVEALCRLTYADG
jgi:hypothetical protein